MLRESPNSACVPLLCLVLKDGHKSLFLGSISCTYLLLLCLPHYSHECSDFLLHGRSGLSKPRPPGIPGGFGGQHGMFVSFVSQMWFPIFAAPSASLIDGAEMRYPGTTIIYLTEKLLCVFLALIWQD